MSKRFLITVGTVLIIGLGASIAIFLARGYTFSPEEKRVVGTGIITITSTPDAASVYIDGHLTTATDATISNLRPQEYTVRLVKEGFIPWEKKVTVKEGFVSELKVTLFPAIPTIYPLTYNGVKNPIISPDGSKLAYIVPLNPQTTSPVSVRNKAGVWVWTLTSQQPIAFARGAEPHQIAVSGGGVDYTNSELRWSPDSKQVLATTGNNNYLLNQDNFNGDPRDITPTLEVTLKGWDDDTKAKDAARVLAIKDLASRKIASDSGVVQWSPDETKFMFGAADVIPSLKPSPKVSAKVTASTTPAASSLKVYDLETNTQYDLPKAKATFWLPDSRHIVLVEDGKVSIVDFDGTNQAVIYAGTFEDSLVFAWPDSSRIVLISSVPTPTASEPNLFGINLK
jgi:hypothetical protein